jgi:hypothetical protein
VPVIELVTHQLAHAQITKLKSVITVKTVITLVTLAKIVLISVLLAQPTLTELYHQLPELVNVTENTTITVSIKPVKLVLTFVPLAPMDPDVLNVPHGEVKPSHHAHAKTESMTQVMDLA